MACRVHCILHKAHEEYFVIITVLYGDSCETFFSTSFSSSFSSFGLINVSNVKSCSKLFVCTRVTVFLAHQRANERYSNLLFPAASHNCCWHLLRLAICYLCICWFLLSNHAKFTRNRNVLAVSIKVIRFNY